MRLLIATSALLALSACNVSKDDNGMTVRYDENTAENAAADIGNAAENIAADIGNDVKATGDKIDNRIGDKGRADNRSNKADGKK